MAIQNEDEKLDSAKLNYLEPCSKSVAASAEEKARNLPQAAAAEEEKETVFKSSADVVTPTVPVPEQIEEATSVEQGEQQVAQGEQKAKIKEEGAPKVRKITISQQDLERMRFMADDIDFVGDSKAALLTKTTPLANITLYIFAALILFGIIWAMFTNLEEITYGVGKVVPYSQVQLIQNLEGGIVSKIFVEEGEIVKKGQILVKLDDTIFSAQYREGYAKYLALEAAIARLSTESEGKTQITFPPAVLKNAYLVKRETDLFNSRAIALKENLANLRHSYKIAQDEFNITAPLVEKGVISKIELLRLERDITSIKSRIDSYENGFHEQVITDLNKARNEADILRETLAGLKDRMQRTALTSPVAGVVKHIYLKTMGGVLKSGMPIMEVVPLHDKLIIEARVRPQDIGFVKVGQKAKVKITAYDYAIYGDLSAVVTNISADTHTDERGFSFYEITLKTDKNYLGSKEGKFVIIPGMTASVDIVTGEKSLMAYILKPILRAKEKALRER